MTTILFVLSTLYNTMNNNIYPNDGKNLERFDADRFSYLPRRLKEEAPLHVSSKNILEQTVQKLNQGEKLWVIGPLADSFEQEIIEEMIKNRYWKDALQDWAPLATEDYRHIVRNYGLSILHMEPHRNFVRFETPQMLQDWLEQELIPYLPLKADDQKTFVDDFISYFDFSRAQMRLSKKLLLEVTQEGLTCPTE